MSLPGQQAVVFHLVEWAERQGRLRELLAAAQVENPGNEELAGVGPGGWIQDGLHRTGWSCVQRCH